MPSVSAPLETQLHGVIRFGEFDLARKERAASVFRFQPLGHAGLE